MIYCTYWKIFRYTRKFFDKMSGHCISHIINRPWHDMWAIAGAYAITQEKAGLSRQ